MIAPHLTERIKRLLAEGGRSYRDIAKIVGVSPGSVNRVARGEVPKRRKLSASPGTGPTGPAKRCLICGGMVSMPCRACGLRGRLK